MPYMYDIAAVTADIPLQQFYTDPQAMVRAQLTFYDRVGQDVIAIGADNFYIAEGFGCQTTRGDAEVPSLVKPPLTRMADVFALAVPDPYTQGRMPVMLEALRLARSAVGDEATPRLRTYRRWCAWRIASPTPSDRDASPAPGQQKDM